MALSTPARSNAAFAAPSPPAPFWARPGAVLLIILLYLAVHFTVRFVGWPTLASDDSEQALFSQHFAWSYRYRAAPLYTWLATALGKIMPIDVLSLTLLRYATLASFYVVIYLVARRLIRDPRLAALAAFSFAGIHAFGESSHINLTHSTLMAALMAAGWYVFLRLSETPRLSWYLAVGVVCGLGVLAKWNFAVFVVSLVLACLIRRDFRSLVFTWKTLAALVPALAIALPAIIATIAAGPSPGEDVRSVVGGGAGFGAAQIWDGTLTFLHTAAIFANPFLPVFVVVFALPLWRGIRAAPDIDTRGDTTAGRPTPDIAFIGSTIMIGLALLWVLIPLLGATVFKVRYMYTALLILPVWLFMLAERGRPSRLAVNGFALLLAAFVVSVPVSRVLEARGIIDCGGCSSMAPFRPLAGELTAAGFHGRGTILVDHLYTGGNLRAHFPEARIIDPTYPDAGWPRPNGTAQCLLVWYIGETANENGPPSAQTAYLASDLRGDPNAPYRQGVVGAPWYHDESRSYRLGYRLYDGPLGDCR